MTLFAKTKKTGFAVVELLLLVTVLAGVAAATRLAGQVQILQKQAADTGKWVDDLGNECLANSPDTSPWYYIAFSNLNCDKGGSPVEGYVLAAGNCSNDGSGECYKTRGSIFTLHSKSRRSNFPNW